MQQIAIIGAGGHAREQLELIAALNAESERYEVLGFLVDKEHQPSELKVAGLPILGDVDWLHGRTGETEVVCAIGSPSLRRNLVSRAEAHGARFPTLVHPRASVGGRVQMASGVIVSAGVVISCDVEIGAHAHINIGSTVSHDCRFGAFATLAPGVNAAGVVVIEEGAEIGVGATISDRVRIGAWSVLGAGAVAIDDIPANAVAVGVPARVIKRREPGSQPL